MIPNRIFKRRLLKPNFNKFAKLSIIKIQSKCYFYTYSFLNAKVADIFSDFLGSREKRFRKRGRGSDRLLSATKMHNRAGIVSHEEITVLSRCRT